MDNLVFYDYVSAEPITRLDLGKVAPRSSDDTTLRIGNMSDTYQAEDVIVSVINIGDADQLWLSLDGDTYATAVLIGDVPPNSVSGPFWLRRVTPSTDGDGQCDASIQAKPTSWTYAADTGASDNVGLATPDNPPA